MASVKSEVFAVHGRVRSRVCVALTVALVGALVVGGPSAADGPGSTRRVSVNSAGTQANDGSNISAISADGRFVAFDDATNLVRRRHQRRSDVFVHDRQTGTDRAGQRRQRRHPGERRQRRAGDQSATAASSPSSRSATTWSPATPTASGRLRARPADRATTARVSVATDGTQATAPQRRAGVSAPTAATSPSLVRARTSSPATPTAASDIFVHDRRRGAPAGQRRRRRHPGQRLQLRSRRSAPTAATSPSSFASNLVAGDTNGASDVFVHDRQTGEHRAVSVASDGTQANGEASRVRRSQRRRPLRRLPLALPANLVAGDTNGDHRRVRARPRDGEHRAGQRRQRRHPGQRTQLVPRSRPTAAMSPSIGCVEPGRRATPTAPVTCSCTTA